MGICHNFLSCVFDKDKRFLLSFVLNLPFRIPESAIDRMQIGPQRALRLLWDRAH